MDDVPQEGWGEGGERVPGLMGAHPKLALCGPSWIKPDSAAQHPGGATAAGRHSPPRGALELPILAAPRLQLPLYEPG